MNSERKREIDSCGPGGIKCPCCGTRNKTKKDRKYSRMIRRRMKNDFYRQLTKEQNEKLLRKIEGEELKCKCRAELDEEDEECPQCGEETETSILQKEKEKIKTIQQKKRFK